GQHSQPLGPAKSVCRQSVTILHMSRFPYLRMRRLRQSAPLRDLVRETRLSPAELIYPLFVCPPDKRKPVASMPGVANISIEEAVKQAHEAKSLGLGGIILFGLPDQKDEAATGAWH